MVFPTTTRDLSSFHGQAGEKVLLSTRSFVKESCMTAHEYLAQRLDGARDLYLLALAVGERGSGPGPLGPMIQEARIHFENVIAEGRMAGLDTTDISGMLAKQSRELADNIRPEMWDRLGELVAERGRTKRVRKYAPAALSPSA